MQSITTDSIDIDSLKGRMLGDTQPSYQGLRSAHHAFQHALSQPMRRRPSSQLSLMREEDSGLPSTVPESLDAQRLPDPNASAPKKMSQAEVATQEVSQEYYDQRIEQSRSGFAFPRQDNTQRSRPEGDVGHIDLVSSFVQDGDGDQDPEPVEADFVPNEDGDEGSESVEIDFLPTQDRTQSQRDYFTDTQRFKTPATIGKKRRYDGNTKETPTLPQRPQLRSGSAPGMAIGLSQAFADTQAQTSPFVGQILPQSARPSPNIELEQRPATAPLSSPLKRISEVRNRSAEPASHYTPMAESQKRREARLFEEALAEPDSDSDDDFENPPTKPRGWRAKLRKEDKLGPTKPRVEPAPPSSPPRKRRKSTSSSAAEPSSRFFVGLRTRSQRRRIPSSPTLEDDAPASEAETEAEDEEAPILHPNQRSNDPEDKENIDSAIRVPRTVAHPSIMAGLQSEVQTSPSLRNLQPPSSAGPLVPNTQPSQRASQRVQLKSSTTSGVDFVPQSQNVAEEQKESSGQGLVITSGAEQTTGEDGTELQQSVEQDEPDEGPGDDRSVNDDDDAEMQDAPHDDEDGDDSDEEEPEEALQSSPPAPGRPKESHQDTVPETISSRGAAQQALTKNDEESALAVTEFDTAASHMPPPGMKANPHSSPQKLPTVPDVFGESTPKKTENWSQIFEPVGALGYTNDVELDQSPIAPQKRRKTAGRSAMEIAETASTAKAQVPPTGSEQELNARNELPASQPAVRPRQRTTKETATSRGRNSVYDLAVTPSPQKVVPVFKSTRSLKSRIEKTETKTTQPTAVEAMTSEDDESEASSTKHQPKQTQTPEKTPRKHKKPRRLASVETALTPGTPTDTFNTAPTGEMVAPNAVFACFNGKTRAYYPAWCVGKGSTEGHYLIQWEGYDPEEIDVYGVCSLDLRVGDQVKIDCKGVPKVSHVIHDFKEKLEGDDLSKTITDQRGYKTVVVAPKQRKSLPSGIFTDNEREVPISAIYLDSNMWAQMKDRSYTFRSVLESLQPSGYNSPGIETPSGSQSRARRQTGIPAPTAPQSGLLKGMVFAVSYEDNTRRGEVENMIWSNGGHIVADDGFADLFEHDSMTLKAKYADAYFTALLADKHSRKPKYLQALALGLPCLSGSWVDACIAKDQLLDWRPYLLPAGESDKLEGAAKSRVMPYLTPNEAKLAAQLQSRERILDGQRVAIIVGRGKAEAKMKNYAFFVRAMGVELLEKVADARAAKELVDGEEGYGLIFAERDVEGVETALRAGRSGKKGAAKGKTKAKECAPFVVSDTESIVQSLIFGSRVV